MGHVHVIDTQSIFCIYKGYFNLFAHDRTGLNSLFENLLYCVINIRICCVVICSFQELDDECDTLRGLDHATTVKSNDSVDVFYAAPCSKG